ncbi:ATP-binding protein [Ectothiorhodospiraceae bacterium BW-2]|nr:ATP-binding protein [Ectothiorhodospiraceae bacterium BW-2]
MDTSQLVEWVNQLRYLPHEMACVEFKRNWDDANDIAQYISALANSAALEGKERAWMVWGIDDVTHEVTGTDFSPATAKGKGNQPLQIWLAHRITPTSDFHFHEVTHPKGRIIVLEIFPARIAPPEAVK